MADTNRIVLDISNCSFCPNVEIRGHETQLWICKEYCANDPRYKKLNVTGRQIAQVEYASDIPPVPDWCPCRPENKK